MIVNIFFADDDIDIIRVPDEIGDIEKVRQEFFDWIFDKNNDHKYWVIINNKKKYVSYDTKAFVDWLNEVKFKESNNKAVVICKHSPIYSPHNQYIEF